MMCTSNVGWKDYTDEYRRGEEERGHAKSDHIRQRWQSPRYTHREVGKEKGEGKKGKGRNKNRGRKKERRREKQKERKKGKGG